VSADGLEGLWPYVVIVFAGWLATDVWRWLGVAAATRVEEDSDIFLWVKAVATALVAGVIARLILFPTGSLAELPLALRLIAVALGFLTYHFAGRSVFRGLLVAEIVLVTGGVLSTLG
jgi:hypothetical protein